MTHKNIQVLLLLHNTFGLFDFSLSPFYQKSEISIKSGKVFFQNGNPEVTFFDLLLTFGTLVVLVFSDHVWKVEGPFFKSVKKIKNPWTGF